jgi:hypothetical protein
MQMRLTHTSIVAIAAAVFVSGGLAARPAVAQKKKTETQTPVRVVVQSIDSTGEATQVTGDNRGSIEGGYRDPNEYVHGVDGVTAYLGEYGGIVMDFQPSALAPRRVNFDYSLGDPLFQPPLEPVVYSGLRTHLDSTNVPLQQMALYTTQCIAMGIAYTLDDGQQSSYRNSYQAKNITSVDTEGTAYGVVTRTAEDMWLLESRADGMCNSAESAHIAKLIHSTTSKGKTTYTDKGAYRVAFSMVLTKK